MADLTALTAIVGKLVADIASMLSGQANQLAKITAQQGQIQVLTDQVTALQGQIASDPQGQPAADNLTAQLTAADNTLIAATQAPAQAPKPIPTPAPVYMPTPAPVE